ncbi:flagellar protein FlaG [Methylomarinum sp. Ch1-1]|uniref:Flagellar protein FlaG n=1 Tax=Methylomarinum roseum TaxID=3067653 RepID=A0AAU7NUJ1_9GAMM
MDIKSSDPYAGESVRGAPVVKTVGDREAGVESVKGESQTVTRNEIALKPMNSSPLQKKEVEQAVSDVNQFFQTERRSLAFSVNETTQDVVIEVKDAETDQIIRQIPPEFVIKLAEQLHELSNETNRFDGLLLKDKA